MSGSAMPGSAFPSLRSGKGVWPAAAQYGVAVVVVAAVTGAAFALRGLVPAPSLTLFYVLPVVAAAVSFGWGPSLAATILGVLAYDFFFTQPYYSFTIASPTDITDAALLFVIAAIVSALAAESRRRSLAASNAAEQAEALQGLAHAVVHGRPSGEVAQSAARALNRLLKAPAIVLTERDGRLELTAHAGVEVIEDGDWEAALAAASARVPTRSGDYPAEAARFDFWPFESAVGAVVLGLDFSQTNDGHPRDLSRLVELVGGYISASARPAAASGGA